MESQLLTVVSKQFMIILQLNLPCCISPHMPYYLAPQTDHSTEWLTGLHTAVITYWPGCAGLHQAIQKRTRRQYIYVHLIWNKNREKKKQTKRVECMKSRKLLEIGDEAVPNRTLRPRSWLKFGNFLMCNASFTLLL